ncbi:MAG: glutamine--fructose-6-phosphate transaminase (isomerizing) [bacterium]|nr:glutamine--fructose-6-phosphate transaminase (isomerizing) [bacterium]
MCSVVGYIGKNGSKSFVIEGLSRLEYRGYDSAGYACIDSRNQRIMYTKAQGCLENLINKFKEETFDGFVGIGQTRWATHGAPTEQNAHPHFDCEKTIAMTHNGIIENHHRLKAQLQEAGHVFYSDTDTETAVHLFESLLPLHKTFKAAVVDFVNQLEGAYALVSFLQDKPDLVLVVRKRSPLCVGIGDNEMFIASDAYAFAGKTNQIFFIPDESFAFIKKDGIQLYDFLGKELPVKIQTMDIDWNDQEKKGHDHYMLKEIYEQKTAIQMTVDFLRSLSPHIWNHLGLTPQQVKKMQRLHIIGCGTSWHAARIGQFFFEQLSMMPTSVHLASEFRYMPFFADQKGLYVTVSQSGETADTLESLRMINSLELPTVALTNIASSTMVREAGGFLLTQAGREVAVASTKAFSTQLTALYWLANRFALEKGIISELDMVQAEEDLLIAGHVLENSIENYKHDIMHTHADKYAQYTKAIFLGRHTSYPFAMEAALKLKEIAYIFSQCYPAGELKHGPLALVDGSIPIFIFSHQNPIIYQKLVSNAQEVKARGGHLVVFAFEGQDELCALAELVFVVPRVKQLLGELAMTGLMQFFVYAIAKKLDCPIDKPRNLAKSVTVE